MLSAELLCTIRCIGHAYPFLKNKIAEERIKYEINTRDASSWTAGTLDAVRHGLSMQFGLVVVAAWVLLTALWYIRPTARADVYDLLISRTTAKWCALGPGTTAHKGPATSRWVAASARKGLQPRAP